MMKQALQRNKMVPGWTSSMTAAIRMSQTRILRYVYRFQTCDKVESVSTPVNGITENLDHYL